MSDTLFDEKHVYLDVIHFRRRGVRRRRCGGVVGSVVTDSRGVVEGA